MSRSGCTNRVILPFPNCILERLTCIQQISAAATAAFVRSPSTDKAKTPIQWGIWVLRMAAEVCESHLREGWSTRVERGTIAEKVRRTCKREQTVCWFWNKQTLRRSLTCILLPEHWITNASPISQHCFPWLLPISATSWRIQLVHVARHGGIYSCIYIAMNVIQSAHAARYTLMVVCNATILCGVSQQPPVTPESTDQLLSANDHANFCQYVHTYVCIFRSVKHGMSILIEIGLSWELGTF